MNNQFIKGFIWLEYTDKKVTVIGNTISKAESSGLDIDHVEELPIVTKNTFKNCYCAVFFQGYSKDPGKLPTFSGNKYINNERNFDWANDT